MDTRPWQAYVAKGARAYEETSEPKITNENIRRCAKIITKYVNRESIAPYLLQRSLLTSTQLYHYTHINCSTEESNQYLIQQLLQKHPDSGQTFYYCLLEEKEHIGHEYVAKELKNASHKGDCLVTIANPDDTVTQKTLQMSAEKNENVQMYCRFLQHCYLKKIPESVKHPHLLPNTSLI